MIDDHSADEDHSINIETINVYGSFGSWCQLPPDGGEKGECVAGSSGTKELLGEAYFAHNSYNPLGESADLMEERVKMLNGIVGKIEDRLEKQPGETILLEAYASHPGSAAYNLYMAGERIQKVALYIGERSIGRCGRSGRLSMARAISTGPRAIRAK